MNASLISQITAFEVEKIFCSGPKIEVILAMKNELSKSPNKRFLCFEDTSGQQIDFDISGTKEEIIQRLSTHTITAPEPISADENKAIDKKLGRPKLGVVPKEVTLLPRHWLWLGAQSGGASATIRRLVEQASKANSGENKRKKCQESAYRFLSAVAGNYPNYEEVLRAIFRDDEKMISNLTSEWPKDIVTYAQKLFSNSQTNIAQEIL